MKYMLVFDWLFGHRRDESCGARKNCGYQHYTDHFHDYYDYDCGCTPYDHDDCLHQDFDDDLDRDMFDDDF